MRNTLKIDLLAVVLVLGASASQIVMAQNASKAEKQSASIRGSGCVENGVEAGCLVLKDTKSGTLYNLIFSGKKPSAGMAIQFTGTAHDGPTTCMQGKRVDVPDGKWKQIRMHCPPPSDKKP